MSASEFSQRTTGSQAAGRPGVAPPTGTTIHIYTYAQKILNFWRIKMSDTKLKGMRELSEDEVNLMNEVADLGNKFGELIDRIECFDGDEPPDPGWMRMGKTYLQIGVMLVKRSIGKPENF